MKIGTLTFSPVDERPDLVSEPTRQFLLALSKEMVINTGVAEINPAFAGGMELCKKYEIDPKMGGNCIIIEAKRGERQAFVACLVPSGSRMDLNGFVRKRLDARRVSLVPKAQAIALSSMEYGSINVIGLPNGWKLLIDASFTTMPQVIMGSGRVTSKIAVSGSLLAQLPNVEIVDRLGISA